MEKSWYDSNVYVANRCVYDRNDLIVSSTYCFFSFLIEALQKRMVITINFDKNSDIMTKLSKFR